MRLLYAFLMTTAIACTSSFEPVRIGKYTYRYAIEPKTELIGEIFDDGQSTYFHNPFDYTFIVRDENSNVLLPAIMGDHVVVPGVHRDLTLSFQEEDILPDQNLFKVRMLR